MIYWYAWTVLTHLVTIHAKHNQRGFAHAQFQYILMLAVI